MNWEKEILLKPSLLDRLGQVVFCIVVALFGLFATCKSTVAQGIDRSDMDDVSELEKRSRFLLHRRLMHNCLKEYMEASTFRNEKNRVSSETVLEFKNLFLDNAKVWNDYAWEPHIEYATHYADNVFEYHRIRGLKVAYEEEDLKRLLTAPIELLNARVVTTDPSFHTYRYEYNISKRSYYILNKEKQVIYYDEPLDFDLKVVFYVSSKDKWAKIMDILPVE